MRSYASALLELRIIGRRDGIKDGILSAVSSSVESSVENFILVVERMLSPGLIYQVIGASHHFS